MRSCYFRLRHSWPIRIKVLNNEVCAVCLYPQRRWRIDIDVEFHTRRSPIVLKNIFLEIEGNEQKETAMSFREGKYEQLWFTTKRKEEFIYDDFTGDVEGRLIVKADDHECRSEWFLIRKQGEKLPPINTIEGHDIPL